MKKLRFTDVGTLEHWIQTMETGDKPFGFYDDDGNKINTDLIAKPSLCVSCRKDEDPAEEVLCLLNRADQQGEPDFRCDAYEQKRS